MANTRKKEIVIDEGNLEKYQAWYEERFIGQFEEMETAESALNAIDEYYYGNAYGK